MGIYIRKLIDVELPVVNTILRKARKEHKTFKRYVEELIIKDAASELDDDVSYQPDSAELRSLVGAAKSEKDISDDRLEYILSKL